MTNNMNTTPSNRDIFVKISKKAASSYLLGNKRKSYNFSDDLLI